jgi:hypothetical protein
VGQQRTLLVEHLQSQLMAGAELDLLGHTRPLAANPILRPLLGEIETCIDNRMFFPGNIGHVDADLGVLDLPEPAVPLAGDADRPGPLLGDRRGVEDDDPVGLAEVNADLAGEGHEERLLAPRNLTDEFLKPLAILVVEVGDSLGGFVFELGEQAGHVLDGVASLLGLGQGCRERQDEFAESREQALGQLGRDLSLGQHPFQLLLIASFHDIRPPFPRW